MQANLRRRTFHGVHGPQQAVNLLRAGIGLQREQAVRHNLQMLFRFRDEELQNFSRNFTIWRQRLVRNFCHWRGLLPELSQIFPQPPPERFRRIVGCRPFFLLRHSRSLERERITLLEDANVLAGLHPVGADHDEVGFKQRHGLRNKFNQRTSRIGSDAGIHRILKDVRQLAGNFSKERETIRSRGAGKRVRRNVQALHIFLAWICILQDAGVFPQKLQALRRFL